MTAANPYLTATDMRFSAALRSVLPLLILGIWTCFVRLPFYQQTDKDEFFFSIIAARWLEGGLPYVASFDVKPPGIFFVFAMAQSVFGASLATIKGMEIAFVTTGAYGLYRILQVHGSQRTAVWASGLFPVYTLTLAGVNAVAMIVQLPLIIFGFWATLAAVKKGTTLRNQIVQAFLAGLMMGMAGMIKQTAIFEATAAFLILFIYCERKQILSTAIAFILGAALPAIGFGLYFWVAGHFREMFEAVIVLDSQRTAPDVLASYGPNAAQEFTFLGTLKNSLLPSVPLMFLWGGALFAGLRASRITTNFRPRVLIMAALWLMAALTGVFIGRGLCSYYLLSLVPPLLILTAATVCHGVGKTSRQEIPLMIAAGMAAITTMVYVDHKNLFTPDPILAGDDIGEERVATKLFSLGLKPEDKLLLLNRGYSVYMRTGTHPESVYFHATHLLAVFHTPSNDPLGEALNARPKFIVVADPTLYHITEQPERYARTAQFLKHHYVSEGRIDGLRDHFYIYSRR